MLRKQGHTVVLMALFVGAACFAQEYDIDSEISRLKRELTRIEEERKETHAAAAKDKEEFAQYTSRTKKRLRAIAAETDSVRGQLSVYAHTSDSLGALLSGIQARRREYTLMQESLRRKLIALCNAQLALSRTLPPLVSEKAHAAVSFLKSELAAKSIDNIEAMNRLITLMSDIEMQLMDIQIVQGQSPVGDIAQTVYRLRIGGIFEAVVDSKGEKCALWIGPGASDWQVIDNPDTASRILKAVAVREGKTVPAFVDLPFSRAQKEVGDE
jgi:hypothetical protein